MTKIGKVYLGAAIVIVSVFFVIKSLVVFKILNHSRFLDFYDFGSVILFTLPFYLYVREYLQIKETQYNETLDQLRYKNTYLEHAAKILRHDMNSGINVYIPRGVSAIERKLSKETIKELRLEAPIRLLKDGLQHTQKVYKGVYEFTNLVKQGNQLHMDFHNLGESLAFFLENTAYKDQVIIDRLPVVKVNEALFCTAIDNLIRNGLKYNDAENKLVVIYMSNEHTLTIQDNGRGMTNDEFMSFSKNNLRRENQKESGSGLGLGICVAIIKEHGFDIYCEKIEEGTKINIIINKN